MRKSKSSQRGSIAVELGMAIPIFMLVVCGGLALGRAMVTKHNLESAVAEVTRSHAIAGQTAQGPIHNAIVRRLGDETRQCTNLTTSVAVEPSPGPGTPQALVVTTVCQLAPIFGGDFSFGVDRLKVVVAMPLPI